MIVKNVTGYTTIFSLGKYSQEVQNNYTWTLPDDDLAVFRDARRYEAAGYIEIIEGPEFKQSLASRTLPAWGTITFSGTGTDGDTVTIGSTVFELDDDASVATGNVLVTIGGSASLSAAALGAAINASTVCAVKAVVSGDIVYVYHKTNGRTGTGIALLESGTGTSVSGATLTNGVYGAALGSIMATVVAEDVTTVVVTGLADVSHVMVQLKSSADAVKAFTGTVGAVNGVIVITDTSAQVTAGDLFTVIAFG